MGVPDPPSPDPSPSPSPKKEFRTRVGRYARLRAAQRALAAAAPLPTRFEAGDQAREQLRALEADPAVQQADAESPPAPAPEWPETLKLVDSLLGQYGRELREAAESVSGAQLRATLPRMLGEDRPAVAGLLDLCLAEKSDERSRWLSVTDYLVTLLATEEGVDGSRTLSQDPAQLTPRLRRLCAAWGKRSDTEAARVAALVRDATESLARSLDATEVIEQVKQAKATVGDRYFDPGLLRAVVAYNVAAFNRLRHQADLERSQDQVFYGRVGFEEGNEDPAFDSQTSLLTPVPSSFAAPPGAAPAPPAAAPAPAPTAAAAPDADPFAPVPPVELAPAPAPAADPAFAETAPEPGPVEAEPAPAAAAAAPEAAPEVASVFTTRGVWRLDEALANRLHHQARPSESDGPAELLAQSLPRTSMKPWELAAFEEPEPEKGTAAVRIAVALALALELGEEAESHLAALGIDPAVIRDAWVRELEDEIQAAIKSRVGAGDYDGAKQLQHTKGRLPRPTLRPAASEPAPLASEATGTDSAHSAHAVSSELFEEGSETGTPEPAAAPRRAAKKGRDKDRAKPKKKRARRKRGRGSEAASIWRAPAAAALVGAIAVGGLMWSNRTPTVHVDRNHYSVEALKELSPELLEGFTVERSGRRVFVATVAPGWAGLSADEREKEARSVYDALGGEGVEEVILVDSNRKIEIQLVENQVRFARP